MIDDHITDVLLRDLVAPTCQVAVVPLPPVLSFGRSLRLITNNS
jgi:hypothetical protein